MGVLQAKKDWFESDYVWGWGKTSVIFFPLKPGSILKEFAEKG